MRIRSRFTRFGAAVLLFLGAPVVLCHAEEVEKKLRVALLIGGYNTKDKVPSESGNQLVITDENNRVIGRLEDPRGDSSVFNDLTIQTTQRATLSLSYAFSRFFLLEGSLGYQKGDVGEVEVQAVFQGQERLDPREPFPFQTFLVPAGELTQVPIQLTGMYRFRPKAVLNPYFGAGIGYVLIGFDSSNSLSEISQAMDASVGGQASIAGLLLGFQTINEATSFQDLKGAEVDARDTFEWHAVGGIEYTFRKKWSTVFEMRYLFASRSFQMGFNGSSELGISLPRGRVEETDPLSILAGAVYGPVQIVQGGVLDGGRLVPSDSAPVGFTEVQCATQPSFCVFDLGNTDGNADPGFYYVHGGPVKYGGVSFQVGIRYTF